MALGQSIVIVNQFTTKTAKGGSRGGTPGAYVTRYMARDLATEAVTPRTLNPDTFITRYMARSSATEALTAEHGSQVKKRLQGSQAPDAGVAFSQKSVSLSSQELKAQADRIQELFDAGHTVMKTVVSFDEDYLKANGLVPADFSLKRRGDYRGQLDQTKLRYALMRGLERMGQRYDALEYVGVIQVDTAHVHAHLAMVDAGAGRTIHGAVAGGKAGQRGKLHSRDKSLLRRGIDSYLDEKQTVAHLSSSVGYERRNVSTYIKKWAYETMSQEADTQLLLASLPEDESLWRATSKRKEMKKPNAIARQMVIQKLKEKDSPWAAALAEIQRYATERRQREGLSLKEWLALVKQGRTQAIDRAVNGMYQVLRQVPEQQVRVMTPTLDVMSADLEELERDSDLGDFAYKFRSYSGRKKDHDEKRMQMRQQINRWMEQADEGRTTQDSVALLRYWQVEEEYHRKVAAKYRHFIKLKGSQAQVLEQVEALNTYAQKLSSLKALRQDKSLMQYANHQEAEWRGRQIYGQHGGGFMVDATGRRILDDRIDRMGARYGRMSEETLALAESAGYNLVEGEKGIEIRDEGPIDFESYKGLDMHQMSRDFRQDEAVGPRTAARFSQMAQRRTEALIGAMTYLENTGQSHQMGQLAIEDIMEMARVAREVNEKRVLTSEIAPLLAKQKRKKTIPLTARVSDELYHQAQQALETQVADYVRHGQMEEAQDAMRELD